VIGLDGVKEFPVYLRGAAVPAKKIQQNNAERSLSALEKHARELIQGRVVPLKMIT
jgi:hypothetical protein